MKAHIGRMTRFLIVGASITGFNFLLYYFLIEHGWHYLAAIALGWAIGTLVSFFGNKYLTFTHRGAIDRKQVTRFVFCYVTQLIVGSATIVLMIDGLGIDYIVAFFINVAITSAYSYLFLHLLVFPSDQPGLPLLPKPRGR